MLLYMAASPLLIADALENRERTFVFFTRRLWLILSGKQDCQ